MISKIMTLVSVTTILLFTQCNRPTKKADNAAAGNTATNKEIKDVPPQRVFHYHTYLVKDSGLAKLKKMYDTAQLNVIFALNRVDKKHVSGLDTLIIPDTIETDLMAYSPYPQTLPFLSQVDKIIFFSYPVEAFGAYEHGRLVRWGPTNIGRKDKQTPTGLTYVNWKKEVDTSTVKDEWIMKWNVNIFNKEGVGFHEYDLPGYPASHSCLRLLDNDAEYLYSWVKIWDLKGTDSIVAHGTPVIVFGQYPFGHRMPWRGLLDNPHAIDISADSLKDLVQPHMQEIMEQQQKLAAAQRN